MRALAEMTVYSAEGGARMCGAVRLYEDIMEVVVEYGGGDDDDGDDDDGDDDDGNDDDDDDTSSISC
jgi:hypothetical protein